MSRRGIYDNWGKLVEATLKRELDRELALCPSFSSSTSFDLSSCSDDSDFHVNELAALSSSSKGVIIGSSSSNGANNAGKFAVRLITALAHYIRRKPLHKHLFDDEVNLGHFKRFSLHELQVASDNFSTKNITGRGGFGKVYKGYLPDGSLVAIKRLKEKPSRNEEIQFKTEVEIVSIVVHPNLLGLLGICMTPTERMLVHPYMSNGNVASILRAIPRFDGSYDQWSMLMENFLRSKEYWKVVDSGVAEPAAGTTLTNGQKAELEAVKLMDLKAKNYLFQAIDRSILETILHKDTSKQIWDSMKKKCQGNARAKRV